MFISQRNSTFDSRYKFTAKELDNETQYTYFGARYYDSDISIWLSVDPMADQRSWVSPYSYCQNNPIGRVDPDGALDGEILDGFTIDRSGNIQRVDNTGGNEYDVLYNKADYDAGKRDYDETGTKSGMKVVRGEISGLKKTKMYETEINGERTGNISYNYRFEVKSDILATSLLQFLNENSNNEWANLYFMNKSGKTLNVMSTSKNTEAIEGMHSFLDDYFIQGWSLIRSDHNHPIGSIGSSENASDSDFGFKDWVKNYTLPGYYKPNQNAKFRILYQGKFYNY